MDDNQYYLSETALEKLQEEHDFLINTKKKEYIELLEEARRITNKVEDSNYAILLEELNFIDMRIAELKEILSKYKDIRKKKPTDHIDLGSYVELCMDPHRRQTKECIELFQIVNSLEVDPLNNKISKESPLGKALLGKTVESEITVDINESAFTYRIIGIY